MPKPAPKEIPRVPRSGQDVAAARSLRGLVTTLILVLTFEGLARKLQIPGTNVPIFFLKDVITMIMGLYVVRMSRPPAIDFLWGAYLFVSMLFIPVIAWTALHDPLLALFGTKEYLLYPIVAFSIFLAYQDQTTEQIVRFYRWIALLLIPTCVIALIQLRLPATHWLNLSVEGESLGGFSAGGQLRVSSTFSFVAQYAAFLNAEFFILFIALNRLDDLNFFWKVTYLSLVPFYVISSYITGSRGAVIGGTTVVVIALVLLSMKFQVRNTFRLLGIALGLGVVIVLGQYFLPDEFAAYSDRERGNLVGVSGEIQHRLFISFFSWLGNMFSTPFFGNGLGVMSNGTDSFSDYAAHVRAFNYWTETDFATTLFEGGLYLVFVWYAFRYFVIYQMTRRFLADVTENFSLSGAFSQAYVILLGFTSPIGLQPPMAIWWWTSVGTSLVIWWKCVEPQRDAGGAIIPRPPLEKRVRGRSAYADRLHR
jgi:hypothetical protein